MLLVNSAAPRPTPPRAVVRDATLLTGNVVVVVITSNLRG